MELDLPAYYKWLDEEKQEGPPLSERVETLITDILNSAKDDLLNKLDGIVVLLKKQVCKTGFS